MNTTLAFTPFRARAATSRAVRQALRRSSGAIAAGLALSVLSNASAASFPPVFRLSSLLPLNGGDDSAGIVLNGIDADDWSGGSVKGVGDVNGDGIGDFIVGAARADHGGRADAGESYVVFGQTAGHAPVFPLARLRPGDGSLGFVLDGIDANDMAGAVSGAGDVNGDGISDLIIGARGGDPGGRSDAGESYVVFGRDVGQSGNFPGVFRLATLLPVGGGDGSAGFVLNGVDQVDSAGAAVSAAGDVNGDGLDDLLVGAPNAEPGATTSSGQTFVVFGRDTTQSGNFPARFELARLLSAGGGEGGEGFVLNGFRSFGYSGTSLSAAGDVNGDGIDDIVIGAPHQRGCGPNETYVVFGRNAAQAGGFPAEFELSTLLPDGGGDSSDGFVLMGPICGSYSGFSVSAAGDVNGDGIGDLIIGAPEPGDGGRTFIVFGRDTAQSGNFPAELELYGLLPPPLGDGDGSDGFVLGSINVYDNVGTSVSGAGDVNGDGLDDILVGAPGGDPLGQASAGESYVIFGRDTAHVGNFPAEFPLSTLLPGGGGDGSDGFVLSGIKADDASGIAVSVAGDLNGDGVSDLLIGASLADPGGRESAGTSYVVFGRR